MMDSKVQDDGILLEESGKSGALELTDDDVLENNPDLEKTETGDENPRGNWGHKADFILSLLGYAVGLTNVWRFPYVCYRNGGGAFLIPYWIFLLSCGVPLFTLEVSLGQFTSKSALSMWTLSPIFKGVGYATVIVTVLITTYYEVLMAYIVFYFSQSFTLGDLPWKSCGNWWNTDACFDYNNKTLVDAYAEYRKNNGSIADPYFAKMFKNASFKSPSEEYFTNRALQIGGGLDDMGSIVWGVFFSLIPTWVITGLCLIKGVKSSGKAVYFTATFPYVMLFALLIRGVTLPGAIDGIKFFIIPDFKRLLDPQVWCDAAFQVFFSLGPGWGGLVTMGSYNKFHNNCYRDGIMVPIIMGLSSLFAGFVVFSVAGFMSTIIGRSVGEVIEQGPQLAFVMYPEVLTKVPWAPLWSVLFFFMLYTLGLDSMFVMIETAITAVWDELPKKYKIRRIYILVGSCVLMFLAGIPATCRGGMYLFQVVDNYAATYTVLLVCILELFAVCWLYGAERFLDDIKFMIGYRPPLILWSFIWRITSFGTLIVIFMVSVIQWSPLKEYQGYIYPEWSKGLGWFFTLISFIWIPGWAIFELIRAPGNSFKEKWKNAVYPTPAWGPALASYKREWVSYAKSPEYGKNLISRLRRTTASYSVVDQTTKTFLNSDKEDNS